MALLRSPGIVTALWACGDDFGLRKGLDHLNAVRTTFQAITDRFAGFQAEWLNSHVDFPLYADPALAPGVETMAHKIAGSRADAEALERARRIAEAQVDLNRVRADRRNVIALTLADPDYQLV